MNNLSQPTGPPARDYSHLRSVTRALSIVRNHFQKEEEVLFSIARQTLDEETQIRLGKAWAETRRVTIA